jgi:uncharacterized membrane protein
MADSTGLNNAERLKFFTDAVVAIAMTLLILPLLENVSEAAKEGVDTATFLGDHGDQIFAFVLSFVIIARFWVSHERLFDSVERWTGWLMLLNILWMLSVVVLPVVTAMVGSMDTDRLQIAVYVGTMLVNSLLMAGLSLLVLRNPVIWGEKSQPDFSNMAGSLSVAVMMLVALVIALALPGVGYLALLVLFLSNPLQGVLERRAARSSGLSRPPRTRR